ncbi:hypothetical protein L1987_22228 [Smallanthus sonchifolius]|uniref:Uncharacterized protein n=1 Tax=Smallanthus sonchifolius TaxID=185202 RepID=A0ACB9IEG1_9ASTR|nr:hypothetical protein L1987_22228 [Smallanthus sonchifolius]
MAHLAPKIKDIFKELYLSKYCGRQLMWLKLNNKYELRKLNDFRGLSLSIVQLFSKQTWKKKIWLEASKHPFVIGEPVTCPYMPAPEAYRVVSNIC